MIVMVTAQTHKGLDQILGAIFVALMRTVASAIEKLGETPPPQRLLRNLPMSYREDFANYIALRNRANSRKAPSFFKGFRPPI